MRKKVFLTALLIFSLTIVVSNFAQGRFSKESRIKMLQERLSLTPEQTTQLDSILTKTESEAKNVTESGSDRREVMMKIRESSNSEIMNILNDEQKQEFKKYLEERIQRMNNDNDNKFCSILSYMKGGRFLTVTTIRLF